ncbi:MAG: DUF4097 domain-containing protein [Clostridiales Family XIII bacterium]|jgi:hypothetical protein|nr:DUF4097 domain-containing protein [Clostridiales Family XIII bacterium]
MNSKLKVIIIIGVVVLLSGVGLGAAGYAMGGMKSVIMQAGGPLVIDESDETKVVKVDEVFENVAAIDINLGGIEKVTIKEGPSLRVKGQHFLFFGGLKAERGADGTLAVTHSVKNAVDHWIIDFPSVFRAAINPYPSSYLEITIPRGVSLTAVNADIAFGDMEIDAVDLERMDLKLDSGNVSASNITCGSLDAELSFGELDARNVNAGNVVIDSDSGNIELWDLTASGDLTIASSFGNIDLEAVNAVTSNFTMSSGDFSAGGMYVSNGMKLNSSFGDIKITGDLRGDSAINSDSGNLDLTLSGARDDYAISVESDAGEVRLDDSRGAGGFNGRFESGPSSAPDKISIDSSFGDVDVAFRG